MHKTLRISLLLVAAATPLQPCAQTCNSADRAIAVILDASGSMNARLAGGETRWVAAQRAVKGVAGLVPGKAQLSLRMYGAQSPASRKDCQDTHVPVPFGPAESVSGPIAGAVDSAKAQGFTPISHSLEQAGASFPANAAQRVIVLVSDGKETCKGDPVVTAKALAAKGITIHAIGFVVDSAAQMQLQSITRATGGTYFDAPAGTELPETLKAALNACPQKAVVKQPANKPGKLRASDIGWLRSYPVSDSQTGKQVGTLDSGKSEIALPPGTYEVSFGPASWKGIEVRGGETTTISPATLKLSRNVSAALVDTETGEIHAQLDRMLAQAVVIPGTYDLVFGGGVMRWPYLKLDGGKTLELHPVEIRLAPNLKWSSARMLHDGRQIAAFDRMTWSYTFPPGDYAVEVDGKTHRKSVLPGEVFQIAP